MWIGANIDGLLAYRDGVITKYTMKDGLPSNAVRGIVQDRDGSLWLGTRGGGLAHFKDGTFKTYTEKDGLATNGIQALFMDHGQHALDRNQAGPEQVQGREIHDLHRERWALLELCLLHGRGQPWRHVDGLQQGSFPCQQAGA